jgi:hypothetical protein
MYLEKPGRGIMAVSKQTGPVAGSVAGEPAYVTGLEVASGAPSQAAFGSAVFYEPIKAGDDLAQAALAEYKYFTGELWERWGEAAWMGPWKEICARPAGGKAGIVAELRSVTDRDARSSVPMILDNLEGIDAERARAGLSAAFDDSAVTELVVYNVGDGGADVRSPGCRPSRRNGRVDVPGISVGLSIFPLTAKGGVSRTTHWDLPVGWRLATFERT